VEPIPAAPAFELAAALRSYAASTVGLLAAMALVAAVEAAVPLHARRRAGRRHLGPNLALTALYLALNLGFQTALLAALVAFEVRGLGLLPALGLPALASAAVAFLALDAATWGVHVAMHLYPGAWRFHRVHHSDAAVDVTTAIRQHPGESLLRYAALAATGLALGASPAAFAAYRLASALQALLEHANWRVPARLDGMLSRVIATPNLHKVHHSRLPAEADTNYGNIFSLFDRAFGTFTPSARGPAVAFGLDGFDDDATQSTLGLLQLPFRPLAAPSSTAGPGEREFAGRSPAIPVR
jgi:sterol desaturase/sphingolipid hydroxylase (fatty acid hydroxylase superfamily)